jgi:hypothetical protein
MMFYKGVPPLYMANRVLDFNFSGFIEKGFKRFTFYIKTFDITYIFKRRNKW